MGQEERIQNAYRGLGGKRTFYDGMITCSTLSGWAVCRLVWGMGRAETQDYLCAAFWGRQFRHRTLTQRLSCVPGQGGCLAGDLSCTAARRDRFYVRGQNRRTDWLVRRLYVPKGWFTPPFETAESLRRRLEETFGPAKVRTVQGIASFVCRKAKAKHP